MLQCVNRLSVVMGERKKNVRRKERLSSLGSLCVCFCVFLCVSMYCVATAFKSWNRRVAKKKKLHSNDTRWAGGGKMRSNRGKGGACYASTL